VRDGTRSKTVISDAVGEVRIDVPRDREGGFEQQIVKKRQRRLSDVDEIVLSLYAKGLTTGEISAHFAEIYGASVSKETISRITDKVVAEMGQWATRPLDAVYVAVFSRFPIQDTLLAETGTAPVTRASGRSRTVRFRYAANKRMRHAIDWWAFVSVRENDWAREAYQQARSRGQLHSRALRGVGARWVRILWRCWTDSTPYEPARHLNNHSTAA
jgi:transposase